MEAFEQFVALAMESEGLVVSEAQKFPVQVLTKKAAYVETQTHGFEVDLVGARSDRLLIGQLHILVRFHRWKSPIPARVAF